MSSAAPKNPTVTNKYARDFTVPPEFPEILNGLTKEILRSQPSDIDKFGKLLYIYIKLYLYWLHALAISYFTEEIKKRAERVMQQQEK